MFTALGDFVTRRRWYVIATWVVLAVVVVSLAPHLKSTQDQSDFLPRHYESIQAADLQEKAFPSQTQPGAIIVFDHTDGSPLSTSDLQKANAIVAGLKPKLGKAFDGISAAAPSKDKDIAVSVVGLAKDESGYDNTAFDSVKSLRSDLEKAVKGTGLREGVTGTAASGYDSQEASKNAEAIVGGATFLLIIILLAIIFRSVIIALMPIVLVGIVSFVATGLIGWANQIFDLKADSSVQVILIVVLFGIGTDYILFFLFRYRERLQFLSDEHAKANTSPEAVAATADNPYYQATEDAAPAKLSREQVYDGVSYAVRRAGEAIASAGGAVIVSFLALTLSSLGIFKSIGPALAIAVAVTLLAALTLVPAVVAVIKQPLFWPSKAWRRQPQHATFGRIGKAMAARPARFAIASGGVLVVLAIFAFTFNPTFDLTSSGTSAKAESTKALNRFEAHLPKGQTDPTTVYLHSLNGSPVTASQTQTEVKALQTATGVASATAGQASSDGETVPITVILSGEPASQASIDDVKGPIRTAAHGAAGPEAEALVGGTTSVFVDFDQAMKRDYSIVFPVAAVVILLILMLLLRSLVAPFYLLASVGLGFGATLGATTIVFQHIKGDQGIIFLLPIYIYLFVVALGTDYNILMIARLREEAREGRPPREAAAEAVKHAAPTVGAAGLILAGTFASLMFGGNGILVRLGFSVSLGIFVSAFVMALFFTPSLTALIGHAAWWPGHGDESADDHQVRLEKG